MYIIKVENWVGGRSPEESTPIDIVTLVFLRTESLERRFTVFETPPEVQTVLNGEGNYDRSEWKQLGTIKDAYYSPIIELAAKALTLVK